VTTLDELSVREQAAQDTLWEIGEEKRLLEQELISTQKMFTEREYSSLEVISLVVVHATALLKSYVPDLNLEFLSKNTSAKMMTRGMHL
jgi:hypothetical protein